MNYQETLEFLYSSLPVFTRDGEKAFKKDLDNTIALCSALGHPERKFRSIHVAGTNGKGSSSHSLASVFQHAGYKTGLYTSPHLVDFRERIRINGETVPESWVVDFVAKHKALIEKIQPSFFELTVAMAFDYFAKEQVDIAIIETGMGGRIDSTNVINPELSLITNIAFDHVHILGNTLPEIAAEKAGIIKANTPVVVSEYDPQVASVFENKASDLSAPLVFASQRMIAQQIDRNIEVQRIAVKEIATDREDIYELDLKGSYQRHNLLGVLQALEILRENGWSIPSQAISAGLKSVQATTGLRGRWEIISRDPLLVCDTGHNQEGWKVVLENIASTPHRTLRFIIGVMDDKDLSKMLPMLPKDAVYYFCQVYMPRALPANALYEEAQKLGLNGTTYSTVVEATKAALKDANADDLIMVGGSTFIVGALLESWPS